MKEVRSEISLGSSLNRHVVERDVLQGWIVSVENKDERLEPRPGTQSQANVGGIQAVEIDR